MIENVKYTQFGAISAVIDGVELTIPDDLSNRHRMIIAEWQSADEGNVILPYSQELDQDNVISLPSVTLWERMTETEADQVKAAMATKSFRTQQIFQTANSFRSDHELWPLLVEMATSLFGSQRASELLNL